MKSAVVMVLSATTPRPGAGGPPGLCFRLLEAFCRSAILEEELYCLCTAGPRLYRIAEPEDLRQFTTRTEASRCRTKLRDWALRAECGQVQALRDAMQLFRQTSDAYQQLRLKPLLHRLLSSHRIVLFHAHAPTSAYKIARALSTTDPRRWRLVITDHSKGGLLSEYKELIGPAAVKDRYYSYAAYQTRAAVTSAHMMAFPSEGARELWERYNPTLAPLIASKSTILYNGVPQPIVADGLTPDNGELRLFAIAQHVPEKGLARIIRGIAELKRILPSRPVRLRIAGGLTRFTPQLTEVCRSLSLQDEIQFLGSVSHRTVLEELGASQMLVAFPRVVVFDLSVLEGMAMGKPIITSSLPGNIEALGSQYPLFASNELEFAHKIAQCALDHRLAAKVGSANRRRYEQLFTSDAMATRHRELYTELLGNHSAPVNSGPLLP